MSVNEIDTIATKMREPCVRLMQTNVALRSHAQTILLSCTHLKFLIQTVHFATKKKIPLQFILRYKITTN